MTENEVRQETLDELYDELDNARSEARFWKREADEHKELADKYQKNYETTRRLFRELLDQNTNLTRELKSLKKQIEDNGGELEVCGRRISININVKSHEEDPIDLDYC